MKINLLKINKIKLPLKLSKGIKIESASVMAAKDFLIAKNKKGIKKVIVNIKTRILFSNRAKNVGKFSFSILEKLF